MKVDDMLNRGLHTTLQVFTALLSGELVPGVNLGLALKEAAILSVIGGWLAVGKEVSRAGLLKLAQADRVPLSGPTARFLERRDA